MQPQSEGTHEQSGRGTIPSLCRNAIAGATTPTRRWTCWPGNSIIEPLDPLISSHNLQSNSLSKQSILITAHTEYYRHPNQPRNIHNNGQSHHPWSFHQPTHTIHSCMWTSATYWIISAKIKECPQVQAFGVEQAIIYFGCIQVREHGHFVVR